MSEHIPPCPAAQAWDIPGVPCSCPEPKRNMYGATPCPRCFKEFRYVLVKEKFTLRCDDCGHQEPVTEGNYRNG